MKVLSLFDGIASGYLVLKQLHIPVDKYYASEIDDNAIKIALKNHPDIIELGDCNNWRSWDIDQIDLIIGGSPCQGFSRNGKLLNFNDPRSKLFFTFVEILNYFKPKNPNIKFFLENVEMKKEFEDVISDYLGVKPYKINSKIVSPQSRSRYYWTNINTLRYGIMGNDVKLNDILDQVDTSKYLKLNGYLVDPNITLDELGLLNFENGLKIKQATKQGYIIAYSGDGINLSFPKSKTRRGRVVREKSPTLDCQCNVGVFYNNIIRKFTINELEKIQGLPVNYTEGLSDHARKKAIGNGWCIPVIKKFFEDL